jgi:C-terminal processing protease CtpA/Prc
LARLARRGWIPSPYGRHPAFDLGIKNPGDLFMEEEVYVKDVTYGGKAYAAGLRKGDKILSVDGFPTVRNRSRAYLAWLGKKKGETLKLGIMRKGTRHTVLVPVG